MFQDQNDEDDNYQNFSTQKQRNQAQNYQSVDGIQKNNAFTNRNNRVQEKNPLKSNQRRQKSQVTQNDGLKLNIDSLNNKYQPSGSPDKDIIESVRSIEKNSMHNNYKELIKQEQSQRENDYWQKSQIEPFQKSADLFKGLTHRQNVQTHQCEVVNIVISNDANHAVVIGHEYRQKEDVDHFEIQVYSLLSYILVYKHEINGKYVKMSQIEQDQNGSIMAIPYQDNGVFYQTVIDLCQRQTYNFSVSNILQIDKESLPLMGFDDPFITSAFFPENIEDQQFTQIFISVYHRIKMINYFFIFSTKTKQVISSIQEVKIEECSAINFPLKTFYNQEENEFYTFFRQGHGVTVVIDDDQNFKSFRSEKITYADFGSMYLLFDKALIVRSSSSILFFKIDEETKLWTQYHIIPKIRGEIFFIQGNVRFQVTTDEKIYFFIMDKETLIPSLENVMYNFMGCSQMMFGKKVRNCITFKANQPDFQLYQRSGYHNFKVELSRENHEGALGANLASLSAYVIADKRHISIHKNEYFNQAPTAGWEWDVPSFEKDTDILSMAISQKQEKIAILIGKKIVRQRKKLTEIVVYSLDRRNEFKLDQRKMFLYNDACIQFFFSATNSNELLFFTKKELFKYNYQQDNPQKETIYQFQNEFMEQPTFSYMNYDQTKFILTSNLDMLFVDLLEKDQSKKEIDIDEKTKVSHIKSCMGDESYFYILANKKDGKLGFYLMRFDLNNPEENVSFLICWNNKLDIADCDMNLMTENLSTEIDGEKVDYINRQMVVSYKMIGINTYNVFVFDLLDSEMNLIKYWHESYQLWESEVKGFLLSTNDFLILSKDGLNLISLGETTKKKTIEDSEKQKRLIHPLGSLNYLKIEPTNHILFACQYYDDRQICIQTQYNDRDLNTNFDDIYKIKIEEPTLRELLLMQSIYSCKTQSDIELLVCEQPEPSIFFKIFLELETKNLIQLIAFDSRSIKQLLDQKNAKYFDDKFPIFFKNEEGNSAIDIAIENNQIRSVNLMIDYICEYQNVFVYSHLFKNNIIDLIEKGVTMKTLFESKLLTHTFDYDYWPATSPKTDTIMAPYNKSIFDLRSQYADIFKDLYEREEYIKKEIERAEKKGKKTNYFQNKIKYKVNLLTSMAQEEDLITAIAESEELKIFESEVVREMIDYKWEKFALAQIKIGAIVHFVYVVMLVLYVKLIFLDQVAFDPNSEDDSSQSDATKKIRGGKSMRRRNNSTVSGNSTIEEEILVDEIIFPLAEKNYLIVLAVCLCYPIWYDGTQLMKSGINYFYQGSNYIDIIHISMGFLNIYMQIYVGTWDYLSKVVLIIVIMTSLKKTFAYMRIFPEFSSIVTMINCVIIDLRIFMVFFFILIVFFSIILDVIGRNNAAEYKKVGFFSGSLLSTLRLSLGDFDFTLIEGENQFSQNVMFWIVWIIAVIFSSLIFLNFIIAEVSASYEKVKEEIDALIYKERALLIAEAEDIIPKSVRQKNKEFFPEYIVIRQLED